MAYIDPEGMFSGDRMNMLSDAAKFAFPWFWCASNTVGRLELNYNHFLSGPFRQFRKPPTEKQFWDWVSELHESFLMFVYEVEGRIWGQWFVSEKYLPSYKRKADEETPPPSAKDLIAWQKKYLDTKRSEAISKCRVLNSSVKFSKVPENSGEFSLGVDLGVDLGVLKTSSAANAAAGVADPASETNVGILPEPVTDKWFEEQHDRWYYECYWNHTGRVDSRRAFRKCVRFLMGSSKMTAQEAVEFLRQRAREFQRVFEPTDEWSWREKLHPATWLNGKRWEDRARAPTVVPARKLTLIEEMKQEKENARRDANR